MLDAAVRRVTGPVLDRAGGVLDDAGVSPLAVTGAGLLAGLGACGAAATGHWWPALALWLANRVLDGLDGPVARHRGATELGGFLDIVADFTVYSGFVLAVAIAVPGARVACVALLVSYYVSGTAFLALSSMLERRGARGDGVYQDGRSLRFVTGLAEGTETVIMYVLLCVLPSQAEALAWIFTVAVGITAIQRVWIGGRLLRGLPHPENVPAEARNR